MYFLICWVVPFPVVLFYGYNKYRCKSITFRMLLLCVTFPPVYLIVVIKQYLYPTSNGQSMQIKEQFELLQQTFESSYRLRNLDNNECVFWEHYRLLQRLLISFVVIFFIDPLTRMCALFMCLLGFSCIYLSVLPYKKHLNVLHWMEITSLLGITFMIVFSQFNSFFYVFNIDVNGPIVAVSSFYNYAGIFISPLLIPLLYLVVFQTCNKFKKTVTNYGRKKCNRLYP